MWLIIGQFSFKSPSLGLRLRFVGFISPFSLLWHRGSVTFSHSHARLGWFLQKWPSHPMATSKSCFCYFVRFYRISCLLCQHWDSFNDFGDLIKSSSWHFYLKSIHILEITCILRNRRPQATKEIVKFVHFTFELLYYSIKINICLIEWWHLGK